MKAAIDIGSNSVRIAFDDGTTRSTITKLANDIANTGKLSPVGVKASMETLKEYAEICKQKNCESVIAFATEAVRRAEDGRDFIKTAERETGLKIVLLSPQTEAKLALEGADKPEGGVTVCDLGGGSLEVVSSADGVTPDYIKSLPLGVVVLKNMFDGDYRRAIDEMPKLVEGYGDVPRRNVVITGGSACTISAGIQNLKIYDKKKVTTRISLSALDDNMPLFLSDKLSVLRPVCARRADTLPYGAIIIQSLLNILNATEFYVSDSSNLEAALKYGLE